MKYPGIKSNSNRRYKYDGCRRSKVEGVMVRRLTKVEIREWKAQLQRIMSPYVVTEVKMRRAIV